MTSKDYKTVILDKIQNTLKPKQFIKTGSTFKYSNGDLIYNIELQNSKHSTSGKLTFTINIGIGSELLYKLEGKTITSHLTGHFSKRIGDYLIPPNDIWWTVDEIEAANAAASQIVNIINEKVLEEFDKIKSTKDLINLWLTGMYFGLSELERQRYLALLYKSGQFV